MVYKIQALNYSIFIIHKPLRQFEIIRFKYNSTKRFIKKQSCFERNVFKSHSTTFTLCLEFHKVKNMLCLLYKQTYV